MRLWGASSSRRPDRPTPLPKAARVTPARGAAGRRGPWRHVCWVVLFVLLSGCGEDSPPRPAATFALLYGAADDGCPLVEMSDVTFRIDPYAGEPVMAIDDVGRAFHVRWPRSFVAGTSDDPVVRDPAGFVVARDGQRLIAPRNGSPKLPGGWPVCFGDSSLWVQEHPM